MEVDQVRPVSIRLLQRAIAGELDWKPRQAEKKAPLHLNEIESTMVFEGARQFIGAQARTKLSSTLDCSRGNASWCSFRAR